MKTELTPFPELTTPRLQLRQLNMADDHAIMQLRANQQVNQYLDRPKTCSLEDAQNFIKKIDKITTENAGVYWAISLIYAPELIGTICLWNFDRENGLADIGYELNPAYQGKGMMQEAAERIIAYAFEVMEVKALMGVTHPDNEASVKLLMRNGFKIDKNHVYVSETEAEGQAVYFLSNN